MAITWSDRILAVLACGHESVVLSRLNNKNSWTCELCGKVTNFLEEPYRTQLERDREVAKELDAQDRERQSRP
jgi:hypothetical protein